MEGINAVTADCSAGCGRACQVKEDAGIGPLLEPRKTRREYGDGSKHLPKSQDGKEVHRVAKDGHNTMGVAQKLNHLRDAPASDKKCYEYGRYPIRNRSCFCGHFNPIHRNPTMREPRTRFEHQEKP